ncbi:MAG: tetratricopeptide repeat protein [Spirochaetia bacterium]|jgi:TolA-binding protein
MKSRACLLFLLLLFIGSSNALFAETPAGKITALSGNVQIDAFGKGAFIAAILGDALYSASVIKTDADAKATIDLQGITRQIPPGATVVIGDLLSSAAKKGGLGWFAALGSLFQSFSNASQHKNEEVVLGSRAADVGSEQGSGYEWMEEEDSAEEILPQAQADIRNHDWGAALARLAKAEAPTDPSVAWDLAFWKGYCFYQSEDYDDAAAALSPAYDAMTSSKATPSSPANRRILLFQLGSSWFLLGQEKRAVPLFESLVADQIDDDYQPYAYLLLARSLKASGDAQRARTIAQEAGKKYSGTALASEFAALAQ